MPIRAVVLPKLTKISSNLSAKCDFEFLNNLTLADPSFLDHSEIDIILGAAEYANVLKMGLMKSDKNLLAQNTELGWIVSGACNGSSPNLNIVTLVSNVELEEKIKNFFNDGEFDSQIEASEEEIYCENHFKTNVKQNEDGWFVVKLPFKNGMDFPELGESRKKAIATQLSLEKRFQKNEEYKINYMGQIEEGIRLGHIEEVPFEPKNSHKYHYMPHHGVTKESSTTKLRVVYNASMHTSNGKSLNDQLAIGAISQSDIVTLLTNFRIFKYAFTADLEKMYKQILIDESQRDLQRFVFRFNPNEPLKDYRLTTVTFGTANAPYIAIRVLKELAERVKKEHPQAASIIESHMYMDDTVGGAHSLNDMFQIYHDLMTVFNRSKFNIRKWCSNSSELLSMIPEADKEAQAVHSHVKALGIGWSPKTDTFSFKLSIPMDTIPRTKRELTSDIASLFDPLGWISPVVIRAKHLLQLLWKQKFDWDEKIPEHCYNELVKPWMEIKAQLNAITDMSIPRWVKYTPDCSVELHAFSDASEVGFACCIYIKVIHPNNTIDVNLLYAKARVAPLKIEAKAEATIPRLELSGACLLANLTIHVINTLPVKVSKICCYTDSKIVLAWIQGNPKRWKSFVASRVIKITKVISHQIGFT